MPTVAFKHLRVCQPALGQPTQEVGRKEDRPLWRDLYLRAPGRAWLS